MAQICGVSVETVRHWECPRNEDRTYSANEVVEWLIARAVKKATGKAGDPAKRKAEAEAGLAEVRKELMEVKRDLAKSKAVKIDDLGAMLVDLTSEGRRVGNKIRKISSESHRLLTEWLDSVADAGEEMRGDSA